MHPVESLVGGRIKLIRRWKFPSGDSRPRLLFDVLFLGKRSRVSSSFTGPSISGSGSVELPPRVWASGSGFAAGDVNSG